jgi:hypothetical protein
MIKRLGVMLICSFGLMASPLIAGESHVGAVDATLYMAWAKPVAGVASSGADRSSALERAAHPDLDAYLSFHDQAFAIGPWGPRSAWPMPEHLSN